MTCLALLHVFGNTLLFLLHRRNLLCPGCAVVCKGIFTHFRGLTQQKFNAHLCFDLLLQWFGNLVTMKWWNDLWLNEGFATYMEDIGSSFVERNWSMLDQFILEKLYKAFSDDQSKFSHPISVEVKDPKEINNIFDSISYEKV